ncbi:MAG: amidase domain-containing protein [Papillibacter sp.]|nr:amidase domain-containing protein [Papillibacter sp.]
MKNIPYNRTKALAYAEKWALKRNPRYLNFSGMGGDCTNFVSQCVYAGCGVMNYTPDTGWYYINADRRAPAWTGVNFFYNFMTTNKGAGPYAELVSKDRLLPGDVLQLGSNAGGFYHNLVVVAIDEDEIYLAAHTNDAYMRPLSSYFYEKIRFLHIIGARK